MSLEDELKKWAKSPKGQDALIAAKNAKTKSIRSFDAVLGDGTQSLEDLVYEIIGTFSYYIENSERVGDYGQPPFNFGDFLIWSGYKLTQIGDELLWEVDINFDYNEIHRDSWYPEGYPHGAYDIVQLLNNGYEADGYVYKDVDVNGKKYRFRSLKEREGAHFMNRAELACNERGASKGYWVEIHPRFVDGMGE